MSLRFNRLRASILFTAAVAATSSIASAATLTTLKSFDSTTGYGPEGELAIDAAGNLFGTTFGGGVNNAGTLFKISAANAYSTLFSLNPFTHGDNPVGGLVVDSAGTLYGTANTGGTNDLGTVFKYVPGTNTFTTLLNFDGANNGSRPHATLRRDAAGNLFGSTSTGGASNLGTLFKLSTANVYTKLANFTGSANGASPNGALVANSAGDQFGTTNTGGANDVGTVFKLSSTNVLTTLHTFTDNIDGRLLAGGLTFDARGNLYGTTGFGGGVSQYGTIFRIAPDNTFTVLKKFVLDDGTNIQSKLLVDVAGNLFGTASGGGNGGHGTIFKLSPDGTLTNLYKFDGPTGDAPVAGMAVDKLGNLYGTTVGGGANDDGTVFKLTGAGYISLIGDANGDNHVNFDDLIPLAQHYNSTTNNTWATGDFTFDGVVNFDDLILLAQHYNQSVPGALTSGFSPDFASDWALAQSLVPEPTMIAAISVGVLMIRRQRDRA